MLKAFAEEDARAVPTVRKVSVNAESVGAVVVVAERSGSTG